MQKVNKIIKIVVAVLLSLTLITTCLVSGVFARYVKKGTSSMSVTIKKWGVTVTVEPGSSMAALMTADQITSFENSVSFTFSDINIKPGDDFSDAVRFTINGTAEVDLQVRLTAQVTYGAGATSDYSKFKYYTDPDGDTTKDKYAMPIGFTFAALNEDAYKIEESYIADPFRKYTGNSPSGSSNIGMNKTEDRIIPAIAGKFTDVSYVQTNTTAKNGFANAYIFKNFTSKSDILFYASNGNPVNAFELGFHWPYEYGSSESEKSTNDTIATWLGSNANKTDNPNGNESVLSVVYTLEITQTELSA